MGGTTAKMCLIENGEPEHATTFEAGRVKRFAHGSGVPLKVPVIDLIEIGAGGGSIARLDAMGADEGRAAERGRGARPGVLTGAAATEPTVTDADLWLGYLSADFFLGGEMPLDAAAVKEAMDAALSRPAGLETTEARGRRARHRQQQHGRGGAAPHRGEGARIRAATLWWPPGGAGPGARLGTGPAPRHPPHRLSPRGGGSRRRSDS